MSASLWLLTAAIALTGPDGELPAKNVRKSSPAPAARRSPDDRLRALLERSGAGAPLAARTPDGTPDPRTIESCQVTLIDVVDVAAQEAGVLTEVKVREGSEVKEGHLVAQVNDSKVQMARKVAEAEHKVALAEAESDISVRYSKSAAAVAKQDYVVHLEANRRVPGSTPDTEMQKLRLQWEKGTLEIEKAELEQKVACADGGIEGSQRRGGRRRHPSPQSSGPARRDRGRGVQAPRRMGQPGRPRRAVAADGQTSGGRQFEHRQRFSRGRRRAARADHRRPDQRQKRRVPGRSRVRRPASAARRRIPREGGGQEPAGKRLLAAASRHQRRNANRRRHGQTDRSLAALIPFASEPQRSGPLNDPRSATQRKPPDVSLDGHTR